MRKEFFPKEYYSDGASELCHAVKNGNSSAISRMAAEMALAVPPNAVLIPAPQHCGKAVYTLELCRKIAARTGATVCDILRCVPHESLYSARKRGHSPELEFYLDGLLLDGPCFFVDNVISTGKTFGAAAKVIGQISPLVYAVDSSARAAKTQQQS